MEDTTINIVDVFFERVFVGAAYKKSTYLREGRGAGFQNEILFKTESEGRQ